MNYMEDATRKQLLQIALYEDCPIDYKYAACRELQIRQWQDWMITDMVLMWSKGWRTVDIAAELGVDLYVLEWQMSKRGLFGKRVKRKKKVTN